MSRLNYSEAKYEQSSYSKLFIITRMNLFRSSTVKFHFRNLVVKEEKIKCEAFRAIYHFFSISLSNSIFHRTNV